MKTLLFSDSGVRVIADSAVGRNSQPWFLPDFGADWNWTIVEAFRISRLGKGIRPEFVGRYVETHTLLWIPQCAGNPDADFMDGAVVCGEWVPLPESGLTPDVRQLISRASAFSTLKNGDIIAFNKPIQSGPISPGGKMEFEIDGNKVLQFNVK